MHLPTRPRRAHLTHALTSILALGFCGARGEFCEPIGTDVAAGQFDAIIELNPPISPVMFSRYWGGHGYYRIAVVWSEPNSQCLRFPLPPATLTVGADENSFDVSHAIVGAYATNFPKPVGNRGTFRYMYGDYPVSDLRFADSEAAAERVYTKDLQNAPSGGDLSLGPFKERAQPRSA